MLIALGYTTGGVDLQEVGLEGLERIEIGFGAGNLRLVVITQGRMGRRHPDHHDHQRKKRIKGLGHILHVLTSDFRVCFS